MISKDIVVARRWPFAIGSLFLLSAFLPLDSAAQTRTNFEPIPLTIQDNYLVYDKRAQINASECVQPLDLMVIKMRRFHAPRGGFWKGRLGGGLFDPNNPIAAVSSSGSNPLLGTSSERMIDYQDDHPNKSYILEDLPIYGPVFSQGSESVSIGLRIFNVRLSDQYRSLFREAVGVAKDQIRELTPFAGILDQIVGRPEEVYNTNIRFRRDLPLRASSNGNCLQKGYWLLVPQYSEKERRFTSEFRQQKYGINLEGTQVLQLKRKKVGTDDEGQIESEEITGRAPIFLLLSLQTMPFQPSVWLNTIDTLQRLPLPPGAPPPAVLRLREAASDARTDAELYVYRLLRQRFYLERDTLWVAQEQAEIMKAGNHFLDGFLQVPFASAAPSDEFLKDLPNWLSLPQGDEFSPGIRGRAPEIAQGLRKRFEKGDVQFTAPLYELQAVHATGGRLFKLQGKQISDEASRDDIVALLDEYLEFATESKIYLTSEAQHVKRAILSRFDFPEANEEWPLDLLSFKLQQWKNDAVKLFSSGNRVYHRSATSGSVAPLEGVWEINIRYDPFHGIPAEQCRFEASGKAVLLWRPDRQVYEVLIGIWVVEIGRGDKPLITGVIDGTFPADSFGWPKEPFEMSMSYRGRTGLRTRCVDLSAPTTSTFRYVGCRITRYEGTRVTGIGGSFRTPLTTGEVLFKR